MGPRIKPINRGANGKEANLRKVATTPKITNIINSVELFWPIYEPIKVKNRINGIKYDRGIVKIFAM